MACKDEGGGEPIPLEESLSNRTCVRKIGRRTLVIGHDSTSSSSFTPGGVWVSLRISIGALTRTNKASQSGYYALIPWRPRFQDRLRHHSVSTDLDTKGPRPKRSKGLRSRLVQTSVRSHRVQEVEL